MTEFVGVGFNVVKFTVKVVNCPTIYDAGVRNAATRFPGEAEIVKGFDEFEYKKLIIAFDESY